MSNPIPKAGAEDGEMIFPHSGPTKVPPPGSPPIRVAKGPAVWFNHGLAPGGDSPIAYARLGSRTGPAGALPPLGSCDFRSTSGVLGRGPSVSLPPQLGHGSRNKGK